MVGHVGRFHAVKNHTFLLDIFFEVKHQKENAVLLLVGDGALRPAAEEKAAALGISDSVMFMGIRPDVPELMQAMDCFAFPSLYEGIPVTLIEAQAAGLPCVISEGVPEECAKTDLVRRVPISAGARKWASALLKAREISQQNTAEQLVQAGYDIEANAQWLQNYYIKHWKEA